MAKGFKQGTVACFDKTDTYVFENNILTGVPQAKISLTLTCYLHDS